MAMTYKTQTFSVTNLASCVDSVTDWITEVCPYLRVVYTFGDGVQRRGKTLWHQNNVCAMTIQMYSTYYFGIGAGAAVDSTVGASLIKCQTYYGADTASNKNDITVKLAFDDNGYVSVVYERPSGGAIDRRGAVIAVLEDLRTGEKIPFVNRVGVYNEITDIGTDMMTPLEMYHAATGSWYIPEQFPSIYLANAFGGKVSAGQVDSVCVAMPTIFYVTTSGIANPMRWLGGKHKTLCFHNGIDRTTGFGETISVDGENIVVFEAKKTGVYYANMCLFT